MQTGSKRNTSEDITNRLSQLSGLNKVIPSSSVRRYKGQQVDVVAVAQKLDVTGVVIGSMSAQAENIRINVQLVDGRSNSTIWGETYTRPRTTLYEIEEYLTKEISDALGIQLSASQLRGDLYFFDADGIEVELVETSP